MTAGAAAASAFRRRIRRASPSGPAGPSAPAPGPDAASTRAAPRDPDLRRVVVVGTSCSGKSTFARRLAGILGAPCTGLDVLYWRPNWTPSPEEEFAAAIARTASAEVWVIDGNYTRHQGLLWPRATAVVWLNYPFRTVWSRALRRTIGRMISREELFNGCRESFRQSFFSRDSILLWVLRTYGRNRREYPRRLRGPLAAHLDVCEFRRPQEAERFLEELAARREDGSAPDGGGPPPSRPPSRPPR